MKTLSVWANCRFHWFYMVAAIATVLSLCPGALATLGDDATSVVADGAKLQASLRIEHRCHYAVHDLLLPTGGKVREFVTDSGKVFAVSWSGGWRPSLRDIMGKHYDRYLEATKGKRMMRGPVRIELPGLVVVMGGHQRAFFGHVYLVDMLPPELSIEDIR